MSDAVSAEDVLRAELRASIARANEAKAETGLLIHEVNRLRSELAREIAENDEQAAVIMRLADDLKARDERIARLLGHHIGGTSGA